MGGAVKKLFTDPTNLTFNDAARIAAASVTYGTSEVAFGVQRGIDAMENKVKDAGKAQAEILKQMQEGTDRQIAESQRIGAQASRVEPINDRNKRLQSLRAGMMSTLKTSAQGVSKAPSLATPALTGLALKQKLGA